MVFYEEIFSKTSCCCCQEEIAGIFIECSECEKVHLCLECFGLGAEVGPHKASHRYHFSVRFLQPLSDTGNLKVNSAWSAKEQELLLGAIEKFGFGNWQDISAHVITKEPSECKEEYVSRYVHGKLGRATWKAGKVNIAFDHTCVDDGPLSPSLTSKLPALDIGEEEETQLGYMPKRDDYEKEYDNEAEKLVSNLTFSPDDDEVDLSLKLSLVDIYVKRLRERVRRKRVIRDYQLVSQFFNKKKKREPVKLPQFAQFNNSREHAQLFNNLEREKGLKVRLQELYKYRRGGVKRIDDAFEYEKKRGAAGLAGIGFEDSLQQKEMMTMSFRNSPFLEKENPPVALHTRRSTALQSSLGVTNLNSEESESGQHLRSATEKLLDEKPRVLVDRSIAEPALLLTPNENKLCSEIKMPVTDYLTLKAALLNNPELNRPESLNDQDWLMINNFISSI